MTSPPLQDFAFPSKKKGREYCRDPFLNKKRTPSKIKSLEEVTLEETKQIEQIREKARAGEKTEDEKLNQYVKTLVEQIDSTKKDQYLVVEDPLSLKGCRSHREFFKQGPSASLLEAFGEDKRKAAKKLPYRLRTPAFQKAYEEHGPFFKGFSHKIPETQSRNGRKQRGGDRKKIIPLIDCILGAQLYTYVMSGWPEAEIRREYHGGEEDKGEHLEVRVPKRSNSGSYDMKILNAPTDEEADKDRWRWIDYSHTCEKKGWRGIQFKNSNESMVCFHKIAGYLMLIKAQRESNKRREKTKESKKQISSLLAQSPYFIPHKDLVGFDKKVQNNVLVKKLKKKTGKKESGKEEIKLYPANQAHRTVLSNEFIQQKGIEFVDKEKTVRSYSMLFSKEKVHEYKEWLYPKE